MLLPGEVVFKLMPAVALELPEDLLVLLMLLGVPEDGVVLAPVVDFEGDAIEVALEALHLKVEQVVVFLAGHLLLLLLCVVAEVDGHVGHALQEDGEVQEDGLPEGEALAEATLDRAIQGAGGQRILENGDGCLHVHEDALVVDHVGHSLQFGEDNCVVELREELIERELAGEQVAEHVLLFALQLGGIGKEYKHNKGDHERLDVFLWHTLQDDLLIKVAILSDLLALAILVLIWVLDLAVVQFV